MNALPTFAAAAPATMEATVALLGPIALFALVSSITPGPNNVMVTASGLTFGLRRTLPHVLGITLGWMAMVLLCGAGMQALFAQWPVLYDVLRGAGAAYLLYLAWRIAHSGPPETGRADSRPLTFLQAAAFQWVNPKAWVMSIGVVAYLPQQGFIASLLLAGIVCAVVNFPCVVLWAAFGSALRHVLRKPGAVRVFNGVMAILLVLSLLPLVSELIH